MSMNIKELEGKEPDYNGTKVQIYYLDESKLAKIFKLPPNASQKDKKQLPKKLKKIYSFAQSIGEIEHVSLPVDQVLSNNRICGFIENQIPGVKEQETKQFTDYYNAHRYQITIEEITDYFLSLADIVEECHQHQIVIPDLSSTGNVFYNSNTKRVDLVDFHDMQLGNIKTDTISGSIASDPVLMQPKYYRNGIYSPNIDYYTLAIRYFYLITKINIPDSRLVNFYNNDSDNDVEDYLSATGISETAFGECMRDLYNPTHDNQDIREAIQELAQEYDLSPFEIGRPRKLIKKR